MSVEPAALPPIASGPTAKYGWGCFHPACIQWLCRPWFLLFSLCACSISQGMLINSLVPSSLTSLQRRFRLTSTESGLFASSYEVAVLLCLVPVSFLGGRGHKARWVGLGKALVALGSLFCALPALLAKPYDPDRAHHGTAQALCVRNDTSSVLSTSTLSAPSEAEGGKDAFLIFLVVGQILHGIGASPIYTLGVTLLNQSVDKHSSGLYLGIFFGSSVFGPVLGFVGSSQFLRIHGDWLKVPNDQLMGSPEDPDWYGAWWLGFLIASAMSLFASFLVLGFPKKLPNSGTEHSVDPNEFKFTSSFHEFKSTLMWQSSVFKFLVAIDVLEAVLSPGVINFFPKLLENFFSLSASSAALVTGLAVVPAAVLGNIIGGGLIKMRKLDIRGMMRLALVADCACLLLGLGFLLYCPSRRLPPSSDFCGGADCGCRQGVWEPVCDTHFHPPFTFPSACLAGCKAFNASTASFQGCGCSEEVRPGFCHETCDLVYPFVGLFAAFVLCAFITSIPIQETELRSIPPASRSLAFGVRWIFIRLFGTIPSPVLFGMFVDLKCKHWVLDKLGEKKECAVYDNRHIALFVVIAGPNHDPSIPHPSEGVIGGILKSLVLVCLAISWRRGKLVQGEAEGEPPPPPPLPPIRLANLQADATQTSPRLGQ